MKREAVDWLILLGIILPLSLGTYYRNSLWNNELELWQDNIRKSPKKERPLAHLGFIYLELGRWDEARETLEESLVLNPTYGPAKYNLGLAFFRKGRMAKAIRCFEEASELDSNLSESL
jgi:tetratricopeptide (TPR) repeat protein